LRYVAATRGTTEADFSASLEHQLATKLAEAQLQVRQLEADLTEAIKRLRYYGEKGGDIAAWEFLARIDARNGNGHGCELVNCSGVGPHASHSRMAPPAKGDAMMTARDIGHMATLEADEEACAGFDHAEARWHSEECNTATVAAEATQVETLEWVINKFTAPDCVWGLGEMGTLAGVRAKLEELKK
jgi:hypothetical protein